MQKNGTDTPNVDWVDELFNSTAMSYNTSVNVSGGTKLVKYFAAVDFTHEGDLFKSKKIIEGIPLATVLTVSMYVVIWTSI